MLAPGAGVQLVAHDPGMPPAGEPLERIDVARHGGAVVEGLLDVAPIVAVERQRRGRGCRREVSAMSRADNRRRRRRAGRAPSGSRRRRCRRAGAPRRSPSAVSSSWKSSQPPNSSMISAVLHERSVLERLRRARRAELALGEKAAGDGAVAEQAIPLARQSSTIPPSGRRSSSEYCTWCDAIGTPASRSAARAGTSKLVSTE